MTAAMRFEFALIWF